MSFEYLSAASSVETPSFLTSRIHGEWLVLNIELPRLTDPLMLNAVQEELFAKLRAHPSGRPAVICMQLIDSVSSQLAGILLGAKRIVVSRGGRLVLCRVGPMIMEMLQITRLHTQFEIQPRLRDVLGTARGDDSIRIRRRQSSAKPRTINGDPVWMD